MGVCNLQCIVQIREVNFIKDDLLDRFEVAQESESVILIDIVGRGVQDGRGSENDAHFRLV